MANQWLRLWHDMPNDPKWRTIAKVSKQPITAVISIWVHILVNASNATERGRTENWNNEDIASALDLEIEQVALILEAMQGRVLEGNKLMGWEKRQPLKEDGAAERARAWRETKKAEKEHGGTQPNATERKQALDKDKDKEKKESKKGENFVLPLPEWLPLPDWNDYLEMRIKIKKKPTDRAKQLIIIKLDELRSSGSDPGAVLRQSIINNWQNVYGIKREYQNGNSSKSTDAHSNFTAGIALALGEDSHPPGY